MVMDQIVLHMDLYSQAIRYLLPSTLLTTILFLGRKAREESLALDMECLCLFMKVAGKYMDTPKAHNLMDQYFKRLQRILSRATAAATNSDGTNVNESLMGLSGRSKAVGDGGKGTIKDTAGGMALPARIRFMIDDLLDLRENNWVPRRAGQRGEINKPRFLRDIRMEIFKVGQS